ncbi:MAG: TrkH family potassium uptake protein [Bacteroidetes bacterium]|nr:MAG: TrkH family potassium uptake protein [Bacteroidota bacterium]
MLSSRDINIKEVIKVLSLLLIIEGAAIWLSLPISLYYKDGDLMPILISGFITLSFGVVGLLLTFQKTKKSHVGKREGFMIVSLAWVIFSIFGTLPFLLSGSIDNFTDAYFETMSGFTTTGASIFNDIEAVPHGILFWRSMTHWIGGMGIIVLSLAILPLLGVGGMQLFVAEVPGPVPDKLHPRITGTAKRLWGIYVLLTFIQTIFLMTGGMSIFDALCHAFGTMATGGFSTQNASVANYSPYIQYVIILFMFLAGTNFTLHYFALHGKVRKVLKNQEFRFYSTIIGFSTIIIALILVLNMETSAEKAFRDSLFQVISIATTTGFVSSDYLIWPSFAWFIIFLLMFTGGSAGSTGGGMKSIRLYLLFKAAAVHLKKMVHPRAFIPVRYNGHAVKDEIIFSILAFGLFYFLIFGIGAMLLSALGLDFQSAIGASIASLGNIGPGLGMVGPMENYSDIPSLGKWLLSFLMLLGRLELFTILVFLSPGFWKK